MRTQAQITRQREAALCLRDAIREMPIGELADTIGEMLVDVHGQAIAHATAQRIERQLDRANP